MAKSLLLIAIHPICHRRRYSAWYLRVYCLRLLKRSENDVGLLTVGAFNFYQRG